MNFIHHNLGHRSGGEVVEIILQGNAANIQLMDNSDFQNYKNGHQYHYIGGIAEQSPVRLKIPHAGQWHIAVDMRGLRGSVKSSARIV